MRLVQVFVPRGNLDLVLETAEATGVDYAVSEQTCRGEFEEFAFHERTVDYELVDVYTGGQPSVTVLVERPPGEQESPDFADTVRERLEAATGTDLQVAVELIDTQRSR